MNVSIRTGPKTTNQAGTPKVSPTEGTPEDKPQEFQRFEGLTRKLVNVPKRELDEKRKRES